jgi:hypothetical protein
MGLLDEVLNQLLAPQQAIGTGPAPSGTTGVLMYTLGGGGIRPASRILFLDGCTTAHSGHPGTVRFQSTLIPRP